VDVAPAPAVIPPPVAVPAASPAPAPTGWNDFESAVRLHHPALRGFAARVLRDANRTDDVLQEAYLRAFRAWKAFDGPASGLEAWLYRIVYRCCVDDFRRSRRQRQLLAHAATGASSAPACDLAAVDRLNLQQALQLLTPEVRAALVLVHWCGLDYDTAGAVLGIPAGTVGSRLTTGRRALRAALEQEDDPSGGQA
jgi:RNA polymerase sigma factor (sigma-70 family)